ncbi:transcriptional repressor [Delftia sp. WSY_14]|uniref:transcriptional repressor n=1 Tax=unclassified Delftia TaxID=2613839 RepID=UPI00370A8ACB
MWRNIANRFLEQEITMPTPLTANQQRVLDALRQAGAPRTAYALLDQLRDHGLSAPTQVYRALDKLAEQGVVHRLESLNAYVCCSHPDEGSHDFSAFAICDSCGQVDEFVDDALNRCLGNWAHGHAFALAHSNIELHGKCSACTALPA